MKIDRIASSKVQVRLTREDMNTLGMEYPSISWKNRHTREIVQGLLEIAGRETGMHRKGRMLIEVFEPRRGECCFIFTALPRMPGQSGRRHFRIVRPSEPVLYRFEESDDLLGAMKAVARIGIRCGSRSRLFRKDGRYYLFLYPYGRVDARIHGIFSEFGEKRRVTTYTAAALEERGERIAAGDLFSRLTESWRRPKA